MIKRYSRKAMSDIWTDQYRYETWLKVKIYACEALANIGRIPKLDKLKGLIFSQQVLVALAQTGITREEAYRLVQNQAMRVWQGKGEFKNLLLADADMCEHLGPEKIKEIFDVSYHLKYISAIFSRVFG